MGVWFIFALVSIITDIYASDSINRILFTDIEEKFPGLGLPSQLGAYWQLIISRIWDGLGLDVSFYFSSMILEALSIRIVMKKNDRYLLGELKHSHSIFHSTSMLDYIRKKQKNPLKK